jgi:hypothetical protein
MGAPFACRLLIAPSELNFLDDERRSLVTCEEGDNAFDAFGNDGFNRPLRLLGQGLSGFEYRQRQQDILGFLFRCLFDDQSDDVGKRLVFCALADDIVQDTAMAFSYADPQVKVFILVHLMSVPIVHNLCNRRIQVDSKRGLFVYRATSRASLSTRFSFVGRKSKKRIGRILPAERQGPYLKRHPMQRVFTMPDSTAARPHGSGIDTVRLIDRRESARQHLLDLLADRRFVLAAYLAQSMEETGMVQHEDRRYVESIVTLAASNGYLDIETN